MLRAGDEHYKVGIAANVTKRLASIQTGNPRKVEVVTARLLDSAVRVEREIHQQLHEMGADGGTEWFTLEPKEALTIAARINRYLEVDILPNMDLARQLVEQAHRYKSLEKMLDYLINLQQSPAARARAGIKKPDDGLRPEAVKAVTAAERAEADKKAALQVFETADRISTSVLQRRIYIGYGRASRIMDQLQDEGIIARGERGWYLVPRP